MRRSLRRGLIGLSIATAGCTTDGRPADWLRNPFADRPPEAPTGPQASSRATTRVHAVGAQIVAANKADFAGMHPVFFTIGVKEPMLFHRSDGGIVVSESFVDRCSSDDELAAAICHELGQFVAKHAEKNPPAASERDLPPAPRLTSDVVGGAGAPDQTRLAEAAIYDRKNPRTPRTGPRQPGPDAKTLAQNFYTRAGHKAEDYGRSADLIKEAEENAADREIMRGR